jgi:medium-chain acyl-[acyl-carrier-protein] hydrolase
MTSSRVKEKSPRTHDRVPRALDELPLATERVPEERVGVPGSRAGVCATLPKRMQRYVPRPNAARRLICFPYAGAGATVFRPWATSFPADIEVLAVDYPGHGSRQGEPLCTKVEALVADATSALASVLDKPFAVVGYSIGAFVAFEWVTKLEAQGGPRPICLNVCAARAPHLMPPDPPFISALPDKELLAAVQERYGGIPPVVLDEPDLLALLFPVLRADLRAFEHYDGHGAGAVTCPVHAFGGDRDRRVSRDALAAWERHTRGSFTVETFPAAHLFLASHGQKLGAAVIGGLGAVT